MYNLFSVNSSQDPLNHLTLCNRKSKRNITSNYQNSSDLDPIVKMQSQQLESTIICRLVSNQLETCGICTKGIIHFQTDSFTVDMLPSMSALFNHRGRVTIIPPFRSRLDYTLVCNGLRTPFDILLSKKSVKIFIQNVNQQQQSFQLSITPTEYSQETILSKAGPQTELLLMGTYGVQGDCWLQVTHSTIFLKNQSEVLWVGKRYSLMMEKPYVRLMGGYKFLPWKPEMWSVLNEHLSTPVAAVSSIEISNLGEESQIAIQPQRETNEKGSTIKVPAKLSNKKRKLIVKSEKYAKPKPPAVLETSRQKDPLASNQKDNQLVKFQQPSPPKFQKVNSRLNKSFYSAEDKATRRIGQRISRVSAQKIKKGAKIVGIRNKFSLSNDQSQSKIQADEQFTPKRQRRQKRGFNGSVRSDWSPAFNLETPNQDGRSKHGQQKKDRFTESSMKLRDTWSRVLRKWKQNGGGQDGTERQVERLLATIEKNDREGSHRKSSRTGRGENEQGDSVRKSSRNSQRKSSLKRPYRSRDSQMIAVSRSPRRRNAKRTTPVMHRQVYSKMEEIDDRDKQSSQDEIEGDVAPRRRRRRNLRLMTPRRIPNSAMFENIRHDIQSDTKYEAKQGGPSSCRIYLYNDECVRIMTKSSALSIINRNRLDDPKYLKLDDSLHPSRGCFIDGHIYLNSLAEPVVYSYSLAGNQFDRKIGMKNSRPLLDIALCDSLLVCCSARSIHLIDPRSSKATQFQYSGYIGLTCVAGHLSQPSFAVGSLDGSVRLYDLRTLGRVNCHAMSHVRINDMGLVNRLTYAGDSVFGSYDLAGVLINANPDSQQMSVDKTGKSHQREDCLMVTDRTAANYCISPDMRAVLACRSKTILRWTLNHNTTRSLLNSSPRGLLRSSIGSRRDNSHSPIGHRMLASTGSPQQYDLTSSLCRTQRITVCEYWNNDSQTVYLEGRHGQVSLYSLQSVKSE